MKNLNEPSQSLTWVTLKPLISSTYAAYVSRDINIIYNEEATSRPLAAASAPFLFFVALAEEKRDLEAKAKKKKKKGTEKLAEPEFLKRKSETSLLGNDHFVHCLDKKLRC